MSMNQVEIFKTIRLNLVHSEQQLQLTPQKNNYRLLMMNIFSKLLFFANTSASKVEALFRKAPAKRLLILSLLLLAIAVRLWKVEYLPMADDADELAYVYAGQSLLQYGEPISWSSFTYEENTWQTITFNSGTTNKTTTETFVRPWFDHPMLLPLIMGAVSLSAGYEFPSVPPALIYRLPMILMAIGTLWLVFGLTKYFYGYWPAVFSLAIAAGSPVLIIIQRMVVGENVVVLCLLGALYLYLVKRKLFWAGVIAIVAVQAKAVGLVVIPILTLAITLREGWKKGVVFGVVAGILAVGLFLATGYSLAGDSFFQALSKQGYRLVGWSNPAAILSHSGLQNFNMYDFSYYLIVLLGMTGVFLIPKSKTKILAISIFVLMGLIWITSSEKSFLGWYKIPLFLTLVISAGGWIASKRLQLPIALFVITIVNNIGLVRYPTSPLPSSELQRLVILIAIGVILAVVCWLKSVRQKIMLLAVLIAVYLSQSVYISHKYYEGKCSDIAECTVPTVTLTGLMRQLFEL